MDDAIRRAENTTFLAPPVSHNWVSFWFSQDQPWRKEPEIDQARQDFLKERLQIIPNVSAGIFPFGGVTLTRADVEWLLSNHRKGTWLAESNESVRVIARRGLDLRGANLSRVDLRRLPLRELRGGLSHEEWEVCNTGQREAATIHLEGANLSIADLQYASLRGAHLEGADLFSARLEGAVLRDAHFEAMQIPATISKKGSGSGWPVPYMGAANLRGITCDYDTVFDDANFGNRRQGYAKMYNIRWGEALVANINWTAIEMTGEEQTTRRQKNDDGTKKSRAQRIAQFEVAIRTTRQCANVLREQGLFDESARFTYRAQVLDKQLRGIRGQILRFLFSSLLDLLAGYGYKPGRSLAAYLLTIVSFAVIYILLGPASGYHFGLDGALIFSLTSFHGRGFFPGGLNLESGVVGFAALEAVLGLLIEISFIATFTQRFFSK